MWNNETREVQLKYHYLVPYLLAAMLCSINNSFLGFQDPVWDETFKFQVLKKDQYLNVCVWSKSQEKNEKDTVLGYVRCVLSPYHELLFTAKECKTMWSQPYFLN